LRPLHNSATKMSGHRAWKMH